MTKEEFSIWIVTTTVFILIYNFLHLFTSNGYKVLWIKSLRRKDLNLNNMFNTSILLH